jgi:putative flippase GtrA
MLLYPPALQRFLRYAIIGVSTLLLDLVMLYIAVSVFGIAYYFATPCSFLIAITCNYMLSRRYVFTGTERSWRLGYAYFALVALLGAGITTGLVAGLVSLYGVFYLFARVLVAGVIGIGNYLFNLFINFRVAGRHESI